MSKGLEFRRSGNACHSGDKRFLSRKSSSCSYHDERTLESTAAYIDKPCFHGL